MPLYDYLCDCGLQKEIFHLIAELKKPTPETKAAKLCTCGKVMKQGYLQAPLVVTPTSTALVRNNRKKRNTEHFKKEIFPTITDKDAKQRFSKKHSIKM